MRFDQSYRTLFETFGYPLTQNAGVSSSTLAAAEKTLNVRLPLALRDYFLVAGNEKRFNKCHNRLIAPKHWAVDKKRLIFMEENQAVVLWGVSIRNPDNDDPPVSQAINDDPLRWYQENRRFSVYIAVMLHFQAVCGGMRYCGRSPQTNASKRRLKTGWTCHGSVNRLTAYSRQNQVVCVEPDLGILAAGKTKTNLQAIADDLGLEL